MKSCKEAILNVGSDNITLAVIDRKYPNSFSYEASKSYSGFQDGEFFDKIELSSVISALIKECEASVFSKIGKILVGVPGEFTIVVEKNVELSLGPTGRKVTTRDADNILIKGEPSSTEKYIAINASPICYVLDENECTIIPEGKFAQNIKAQISYVLCEKYFYNIFTEIADNLKLNFEFTSILLAEIMYILPQYARDRGAFLVDIGYISSSVTFSQGDGILYAKSFSLGGGNIAGDITQVMDIPFEHSLNLLSKINLNLEPKNNDQYLITIGKSNYSYNIKRVNEIALDRVVDIVSYVKKAIEMSPFKNKKDSLVYLTGSGLSNIIGAKEIMARIIGQSVEIISSLVPQYNKPSFSSLASLLVLQQKKMKNNKNKLQIIFEKAMQKTRRR
jgi:cell division ATPase FtsA